MDRVIICNGEYMCRVSDGTIPTRMSPADLEYALGVIRKLPTAEISVLKGTKACESWICEEIVDIYVAGKYEPDVADQFGMLCPCCEGDPRCPKCGATCCTGEC